ncbi:zinc-ribbon domain-containing protein [Staphylococcus haemolyticus]|uniref:Zinc-ribbon domain-containing protein n=2 Tax=Staphylococcus haemolyticus TaxID=1283 RepID=Q4L9X3_STAHJ|nr:zinc-ribbon domain-containing protein [Staphylococcus haemolyticus]MBU6948970.1 zinc-ribbon domain-containing protein [Staphylococcus haemolyticus]MBU7212755.1 zinc-ribbon domain-containing protein [Staphylococcus haemolyticus]MCE5022530.1 zinc-ribbon domain-containing protein [Staphylococcus haemolyticus]PTK50762.1 zinc ribbon domain-containing protein [Staphylococcus haemolyticus]PTK57298.1 zinc ribbon domain-containing protein [Staphylococcus haemolyticus]
MKFCPECGNKLIENAKFCPECGFKIASINNNSQKIEEVDVVEKVSSDVYIKSLLNETNLTDIMITPDIPEKVLINASVSIAEGIDPNTIIALIDTSLMSNGKSGVVFTGAEMYLKTTFDSVKKIPFENIKSAEYDSDRTINNKGKVIEYHRVIVSYGNGEDIEFSSEQFDSDLPYKLIAKLLNDFNKRVDNISSKNQVVQISQMSSEILELYFRIVIAYLKDDDGIIDSREYKELISLMTKIKVSKQLANDLRKYRFEDKEDLTIEELIDQLKNQTNKDNFSEAAVEQTLAMDIIGMNSDKLDTIKDDEVLVRMLNRLNISDKQLKFIVRKIKADKEIIESRMTDSEIKEVNKELAAVASGAGLVALGLLTSGGTVYLGIIAGFGVYRGIKYFSGTGEAEKFGIRIQTLNDRISQLRIANAYIIEDINWLSQKMIDFALKLRESNELSSELYKELELIINQNQSLADAGSLIEDDESYSERELLLTTIPESLDIGKYNELLAKNINKVYADEVIKNVYSINGDLDNQSEVNDVTLRENIELDELKAAHTVLEDIGYFDTKASSIAQSKSLAKKGFSGLKKSLFSGEKDE